MASVALPLLFALFVWWLSTGVILLLSGLGRHTYKWTMLGASVVFAAGLAGLYVSRADTTTAGAYIAFSSGIALWAWHEVSFLLGSVTGPRREPCPEDCTGWTRFRLAVQVVLWHELAILLTVVAVGWIVWDQPNAVGLWTFVVLWIMRISAKLNLFLGVPKLHAELLPDHLVFLGSYFRKRTMNALFPISITAGTVATTLLVVEALGTTATDAGVAGGILLAALLGLAVLEHWFMVLPVEDTALWRWALKARAAAVPVARTKFSQDDRRDAGPVLGVRLGTSRGV